MHYNAHTNLGQLYLATVVTADNPLYALVKEIQNIIVVARYETKFVILMGGFLIAKASLCVTYWGTGWMVVGCAGVSNSPMSRLQEGLML